jgi:hypothetical protein
MKNLLWCSAHTPTSEQLESLQLMGQVLFLKDINPSMQERINNCSSNRKELLGLVKELSGLRLELDCTIVQLGGSPLFIYTAGATINGCRSKNVILFADSERVSEDIPQADGSVKKISIFKHKSWI